MGISMMSSVRISSRRLIVELVEVGSIVQHEDVERERLLDILRSIKLNKYLEKPIIVDDRRSIVIDGHHRLGALLLLGAKVVPAVVARYSTDIIDINSWMYVKSRSLQHKDFLLFVEALESLSKRGDAEILIKLGDVVYSTRVDRLDIYYAIKSFNEHVKRLRLAKAPNNIRRCLESDICITMPRLTIDDVYRVSLKSEMLPPRTTLHITPLKSIYLPYALKKLYTSHR